MNQRTVQATRKQKMAGLIVTALVLAVSAWGLSKAPHANDPGAQAVLNHYFASIDAGRYDDAWRQDTTANYRAHAPLDAFRQKLEMHRNDWGRIVERQHRAANGRAGFYTPGRGQGVRDCRYFRYEAGWEPSDEAICYALLRDAQGRWAIDSITPPRSEPRPWAY